MTAEVRFIAGVKEESAEKSSSAAVIKFMREVSTAKQALQSLFSSVV